MMFEQIKEKSKTIQNRLARMAEEFPWEDKDAYASWMAQTYEYVRYTTRILALTAGHFGMDKTQYVNRFVQHAAEEKGHDRLMLNDAKAMGIDLLKVPVLPEAEAFHKSVYFWIYQGRPCVILGWILTLECFAIQSGPRIGKRVEKAHGKQAASFVLVHTSEDEDHVEKAFSVVQQLSESDLREVAHGLDLYGALLESMYRAAAAQAKTGIRGRAA